MATKDIKFTASGLGQILKQIEQVNAKASQNAVVKVDAETSSADSKIDALNKKANDSESMKIDADTSNAESKIKNVKKEASGTETIKVDAETSGAESKVDSLKEKIGGLAAGVALGGLAAKGAQGFAVTEVAVNSLKNRLNLTKQEAENLSRIGKNIYSSGFGESLEQINEGLTLISEAKVNNSGFATTNKDFEKLAENATKFTQTFGGDMQNNIRAANQVSKNFGVTGNEAFEIIAAGFKNGANASDDFIDSLIEYGVQFKALGFNAEEFSAILTKGAATGAYNVDFMADAMKEFQIRTIDGSASTKTAFSAIGLNADIMAQKFAAGGETAQGAFNETINALLGMQDPIAQNQAGVALFGTKFEDVGVKGISAFQGISVEAGNAKGAMDNITAEPLTAFFNSIKTGFNDAFGWIGAKLQEIDWEAIIGPLKWLANEAWSALKPFVDGIKGFFEKVGENKAASEVLTAIASAVLILAAAFLVWQIATWGLGAAMTFFSAVFSPIGLIILGIIAAIALIILIFKNWDAIMQWLGDKIKEFFIWIATKIGEFFKWIGDKIRETLTWIATKFGEFIKWLGEIPGKIVDFFKGIGEKIAEFFKAGVEKVKEFFNGIVDFFKSIPQKIADMFSGLGDLIKNALRGAINLLPSIISGPLKNVLGLGEFDANFKQRMESLGTITVDSSRFDFVPNQASTQTYNNQQSFAFNKGIESKHERVKLSASMNKLRGRIK